MWLRWQNGAISVVVRRVSIHNQHHCVYIDYMCLFFITQILSLRKLYGIIRIAALILEQQEQFVGYTR